MGKILMKLCFLNGPAMGVSQFKHNYQNSKSKVVLQKSKVVNAMIFMFVFHDPP